MPYTLEWLDSARLVSDEVWSALFPPPYEGQWWYLALEQAALDEQFQFLYAVVYDQNHSIVALAPCFVMYVPIALVMPPFVLPIIKGLAYFFPHLLHQKTFFVGSPCSDEGRVGIKQGVAVLPILSLLHSAIGYKAEEVNASMRVWKDFPSAYQPYFDVLMQGGSLFQLASFPATVVHLAGQTFDDYLATLKASRRNKFNKKRRQMKAAPLTVSVLQNPSLALLDELFALFWQTYEKGKTKFECLNPAFFRHLASSSSVYYIVLRHQDKAVAFMLCFLCGDTVINKFIGIDYQQDPSWFLYFRLWEEVVNWAYTCQAQYIQSGQTGYAPKIELGHTLVALNNFCQHRNPLMHWLYAQVARTVHWGTLDTDLATYIKAYPDMNA